MQTFNSYHAGNKDAFEYQLKMVFFMVAIYACFGAYALNWIGVGWMAVIVSVLVTRWMIAFHELFHLKKADDLDVINRLSLIPFAPFNLGYREYRAIHMGHHQHTATQHDPDAFHILGGSLKALIGAMTQHEQATFRYISANGLSQELAMMMAMRLALFSTLFIIDQASVVLLLFHCLSFLSCLHY